MQEWNVGTLLGVSSAYWRGCAIHAGVSLQLFSLLGSESLEAASIAEAGSTDARATALLLDALVAMGLLEKSNEQYSNTQFSADFLVKDSPRYMGHIIMHHHYILDGWAQLDQAVTTGTKVTRRKYDEDAERESFLLGMFNLAKGLAPQLAADFDLSGRKHLLDLGGGPGTYAIHFCLANPELEATIFDRITTKPFAESVVGSYDLSDRISFLAGDFNADSLPGGPYDVAWLSHILHSNSYDECGAFIKKTVDALEPGGLLLVHDFILNDDKAGPEFPTLFSLNMLVGTESGRSYSRAEIYSLLESAGLTDIEHHSFRAPNDSSVMSGVKK